MAKVFSKSLRNTGKDIPKMAFTMSDKLLRQLEAAQRPYLDVIKCSLDNSIYDPKVGFFTPGRKKVRTELNVSSVQKLARTIFMLEMMLANLDSGGVNTKRELYYRAKGMVKSDSELRPIDFGDQNESDAVISYLCDLLEVYREELNCYANDRGGQTFSKHLIVTETLEDGSKAVIDLSTLGTTPFQPKNKPQVFKLKAKGPLKFCLVVESEGTANTLVSNGMTKRIPCIVVGAQGVPSNGVRGWVKTIQDQLDIPIYFWGDLDAYTMQNIFRTLKAGSAASLIRNAEFSAPDVHFLGVLPEDVERYDLECYDVKENNVADGRSLKKAKDVLDNDPFFRDKKNKNLAEILRWLVKKRVRCEQQAIFAVNPKDPTMPEKILMEKIKNKSYI